MILAFNISDIIRVPFGYLLEWLYEFTTNYGLALILFSLIVKLILMPISAKSKKSMMKMSRLSPEIQALQKKYADDPQKANQAVQKLYKDEGVSMTGGCLWSLVPLLIMLPLYYVIREPLIYMFHMTAQQAGQVVQVIKDAVPNAFGSNTFYDQLTATPYLAQFAEQIKVSVPELAGRTLPEMNFLFLGVDLGQIPSWQFWKWASYSWANIGAFLLPVASAASNVLAMWVSQKMNSSVVTNQDGQRDETAAKAANASNKFMMWMMPAMTLFIGFTLPGALSLYWLAQGLFGIAQDAVLTKRYRRIYDAEDAVKRELAAKEAAEEAERERIRALRRAEHPEGIVENTSKKKLQKLREQSQATRRATEAAAESQAEPNEPLSGDPNRPFARGRAYRPSRYDRRGNASADEVEADASADTSEE